MAPATASLPADAPPADVALTALKAISQAQKARSDGLGLPENREKYDTALATIWNLADEDGVYRRLIENNPRLIPATASRDAALTGVSESWISMLAHYADGFDENTLRTRQNDENKIALVSLQARNPAEAARLAEIEASPDITGATGPDGRPIHPGTKPYLVLLRSKTLNEHPPFNVPIETTVTISLRHVDAGWRITRLAIDPVITRLSAASQPATPHAQ